MFYWTFAEEAAGIIISCLPTLPRLWHTIRPRINDAFSFWSKIISTRPDELQDFQLVHTSSHRMSVQSSSDPHVDLSNIQTKVSSEHSSFPEHQPQHPERAVTKHFSRTFLAPTHERSAPSWEKMTDEPAGNQILRTTHIETKIEPDINASNGFNADLERQQLRW